jgi:serine/threonine-protein kinase
VTATPIPLNERVPGRTFDPALADVIGHALLKKPEERYESGGQFSAALRPFVPGFQAFTAAASVVPVLSTPGAPPVGLSSPASVVTVRRTGVGLIVGVAAACLVMGVVLAVAVMRLMH